MVIWYYPVGDVRVKALSAFIIKVVGDLGLAVVFFPTDNQGLCITDYCLMMYWHIQYRGKCNILKYEFVASRYLMDVH